MKLYSAWLTNLSNCYVYAKFTEACILICKIKYTIKQVTNSEYYSALRIQGLFLSYLHGMLQLYTVTQSIRKACRARIGY